MTAVEPARWPALVGWNGAPAVIQFRRALRGKVHRARTDYRWIAASDGWEIGPGVVERLTFGWEDEPKTLTAWTPLPGGYAAVAGYPSPARDADGRQGGLEKQVLFWERNEPNPPVLAAAFGIVQALPSFSHSVAMGYWRGEEWTSPSYRHRLPAKESQPLDGLSRWIEEGLLEVRSRIALDQLGSFYQGVLDGTYPVLCPAPLSPLGWLCLWLPVDRETADGISWLSSPPTSRFSAERYQSWTALHLRPDAAVVREAGPVARGWAETLLFGPAEQIPESRRDDSAPPRPTEPERPRVSGLAQALRQFLEGPRRRIDPPPRAICTENEVAEMVTSLDAFLAECEMDLAIPTDEFGWARKRHLRAKAEWARAWIYALAPPGPGRDALRLAGYSVVPITIFEGEASPQMT